MAQAFRDRPRQKARHVVAEADHRGLLVASWALAPGMFVMPCGPGMGGALLLCGGAFLRRARGPVATRIGPAVDVPVGQRIVVALLAARMTAAPAAPFVRL